MRGDEGVAPGTAGAGTKVAAAALAACWSLLLYAWAMNAWLGDDAFITFRTAQNLAEGFGPRWNPHERVQTYTHPLWMLIVGAAFFVTREFYFTVLGLSLVATVGAVTIATRGPGAGADPFASEAHRARAVAAIAALLSSKAFVDYTTSGLENPLAYLLVALFVRASGWESRLALAGAIYLTRADLALLVAPTLVATLWRRRDALSAGRALAALSPVIAWTGFSLLYYGFPFPNTAYAKLGAGIPGADLARQGLWYVVNSLRWDAPTLPLLAAASFASARGRDGWAPAIGVMLYAAYVARIGGDFMTGRFFAVPLLFSIAAAFEARFRAPRAPWSLAALALATALAPLAPLKTTREYRGHLLGWDRGITDERGLYWRKDTGLIFWGQRGPLPMHPNIDYARDLKSRGETVVVEGVIGFLGWAGGRDLTIIDPLGLGDPLLSRLPLGPGDWWGVGHYPRRIPAGYELSVRTRSNALVDPNLREFYGRLRVVVAGPLLSIERFHTIWNINRGAYDHLVARYAATLEPLPKPR